MNARLEELRSKFQENPRRYFAPYANELRKTGDAAQAISVCRAHLTTQPGHVSGHIVLGQALYEAGSGHEARDVFTAALDLDPENLIALRTLGEIAQVNGEFGAARQWYERLLEADPRNGDVSQLLKDLPSAAAAAASTPASEAPAAETTLQEHVEQEERQPEPVATVSPPTQAPSFHTSFTGPGPAYRTPDELAESGLAEAPVTEPVAPLPLTSNDFVEMDTASFADASSPEPEPVNAAMEAPLESIEMVDLDAFSAAPDAETVQPVASSSDEPGTAAAQDSAQVVDFSFDPQQEEPVTREPAAETEGIVSEFEVGEKPLESAEELSDQTRALFAERGFDGPADDQVGWIMTPSAVESDLESAPEDWYDVPAAEESREVAAEAPSEEPVAESVTESEQATDSWFDDTPGAAIVAAAELSTDEFWLPPDLSQVAAVPAPNGLESERAEVPPADEPMAEVPHEAAAEFAEEVPALAEASAAESVEAEPMAPEAIAAHTEATETEDWSAAPVSEWSEPIVPPTAEAPEPVVDWVSEQTPEAEPVEASTVDSAPTAAGETESSAFVSSTEEVSSTEPVEHDEYPTASAGIEEPTIGEAADEREFAVSGASTKDVEYPEPVVGHTPPLGEAAVPMTPAPFVTETLADLYLQQGFRDEALSIYRQLVEREPANQSLRDRVEAIERGTAPESASVSEGQAESRASSQSVRTFFSKLARRPAVGAHESPSAAETVNPPEVPFANAASALANLFAASRPAEADEGAAATLAGAFTDPAGRPSRAADRELSLDHLFRDVPPGGSPTGGLSLDEFYSTPNASPGSPTEPGEAGESAESGGAAGGADIRQFTAWLEGLRKK